VQYCTHLGIREISILAITIPSSSQFVIKAAEAGTVKSILYKKGDTVAKDAPLVTISPKEE